MPCISTTCVPCTNDIHSSWTGHQKHCRHMKAVLEARWSSPRWALWSRARLLPAAEPLTFSLCCTVWNLHLFWGSNCWVVISILSLGYLTQVLFPIRIHPSLSCSQKRYHLPSPEKKSSLVLFAAKASRAGTSQVPSASLQARVKMSMSSLLPQRFIHFLNNTSFLLRNLHNWGARPERLPKLFQAEVAFRVE